MKQGTHYDEGVTSLTAPMRRVATFKTYEAAEDIVDYLSDRGFPVKNVQIVGRALGLVEQVSGRFGNKEAALRGATSGALVGALFGWIFDLFDWIDPLITGLLHALYGLIFGAILGTLMAWISHSALGGRRDFGSQGSLAPGHYDLLVSADLTDRAIDQLMERPNGSGSVTG